MLRFILIAALLASTAAAQTTTCTKVGDSVVCNSTRQNEPGGSYYNAVRAGYERGKQQRAERTRQKVGQLLADGDCAGAEKLALRSGDIELAETARNYCAR